MTEPIPSGTGPATAGTKKRASRKAGAATSAAKPAKESRAEEIIHELFRLAKVDLRSSAHGTALAAELGKLVGCVAAWFAVVGMFRVVLFCALLAGVLCIGVDAVVAWGFGSACLAAAFDTQSFTVTAPGAGGTVMTSVTGDPGSIRNSALANPVNLVAMWSKSQAAGSTQVVFPSGNDSTRNFRFANIANQPGNMLPRGLGMIIQPQELLTVTQIGSAVAGDVELVSMGVYYDELPGINSALIGVSELAQRMVRMITINQSITALAASVYSAPLALSAAPLLLQANTQYAVLGYKLGAVCGCLTLRGPDTGNLRVPMPGLTSPDVETVNWFTELSEWYGKPMIPTFNAANATGTFIEVLQDENLTAVPFSLVLAELAM